MTHKKRNRMYNSGNGIIKREIPHKMSFEDFRESSRKHIKFQMIERFPEFFFDLIPF